MNDNKNYSDIPDVILNIIKNLKKEDIVLIPDNNVYYEGDYGFVIEICGRTDIAKWRRGQFRIPNSDDIYIYAQKGSRKYYKNDSLNFISVEDSINSLFIRLKQKYNHSLSVKDGKVIFPPRKNPSLGKWHPFKKRYI